MWIHKKTSEDKKMFSKESNNGMNKSKETKRKEKSRTKLGKQIEVTTGCGS